MSVVRHKTCKTATDRHRKLSSTRGLVEDYDVNGFDLVVPVLHAQQLPIFNQQESQFDLNGRRLKLLLQSILGLELGLT